MFSEKVLMTGCGGMLGLAVHELILKHYSQYTATDIDLNEPWLKYLDVRDFKQCEEMFYSFQPQLVLHLAALTDLEYCEKNPEDAWLTNALGVENMALLCKKNSATMVYISTAGIFDGTQDVYNDFDTPRPLGLYAKSKYYGERFVLENLSHSYVFRAGWMMGGGIKKDKKFINKIYRQIKAGKNELFVVDDKLGTPTYTIDFTQSILKVIQTGRYGLYNQVCGGDCSRFDVALEFVRLLGLQDQIKVTRVSSDYFKEEYFAPRPASEKLVNLKLNSRKMNYMRDWKTCLGEYSEIFRKDYYGKV